MTPTNGQRNAAQLERDFEEIRDITIVGGGPVGLIAGFWAGMRGATARIVDALPTVGGQCNTLYPEKWIFDVPGHPKVLSKNLIQQVVDQSIGQFDIPLHLETNALELQHEPDPDDDSKKLIKIVTDRGDLRSRALIMAAGHGAFEPKKLPKLDLDPWVDKGVHYFVKTKSTFKNRRVVIVGGGDSAVDWALNLLDTASEISLVHRRDQFRAHETSVRDLIAARDAGRLNVYTPVQVGAVSGDGHIRQVTLVGGADADMETTVDCDELLLQLGFKTSLGPLADWGFEIRKNAIVVDHVMKTNLEGVWACGDITTFDGKLKLIATGFAESAIAVAQAIHYVRPDVKIQPAYSSNTGVPAQ